MLAAILSNLKISDLFKGDLQLTSPPNIYFELQQIIANPDKSITDIGFIIEQDPALSIRLLKIVNSAFFGLPGQITTIKHAIAIIGVKELQNLVLATVIIDKFSSLPSGLLSMQDFWARSLRCALISKELCIYKINKSDLDSIFICGLLHDIGQLVFYRRIPELARQIGLLVESSGANEIQAENNILGFNHYQTGAELVRLWKLPEIIIETIGQHNNPDYAGVFADAASTIRAASYLCRMEHVDAHLNTFCNIPVEDLSDIIDRVHVQFESVFKIFYPTFN
ncbi:HDOD domain-containing protein [Methylobacter sp.]|uniref:HDOD domain-containing protein n=1 Tax=Methylobacter sp. TaxID=2051955 RepID=UPI00121CC821|nr:HDOD domain-containing protein [Methylobacter sp.]TAK60074.1 MAG: HDOD domain-containing protein [Methylobacter sp.]